MRIFGTTKQPPYTETTKQSMSDIPDAEFDIEHMPVASVERDPDDDDITLITLHGETESLSLYCTLVKHQDLVSRFRQKIRQTP